MACSNILSKFYPNYIHSIKTVVNDLETNGDKGGKLMIKLYQNQQKSTQLAGLNVIVKQQRFFLNIVFFYLSLWILSRNWFANFKTIQPKGEFRKMEKYACYKGYFQGFSTTGKR